MRHFLCFFATFVILLTSFPLFTNQETLSHTEKEAKTSKPKRKIEGVDVVLYIRPNCSFCRRVLSALDNLGIDVVIVDVSKDPQALAELISIGGKRQVPCIIVDGKAMYESQSIIEWFQKLSFKH